DVLPQFPLRERCLSHFQGTCPYRGANRQCSKSTLLYGFESVGRESGPDLYPCEGHERQTPTHPSASRNRKTVNCPWLCNGSTARSEFGASRKSRSMRHATRHFHVSLHSASRCSEADRYYSCSTKGRSGVA